MRTSRVVAGRKSERGGGALEGRRFRFRIRAGVRGVNLAQKFVILSSKYCRKAEAREDGQVVLEEMEEVCDEEGYRELFKVFGVVDCR